MFLSLPKHNSALRYLGLAPVQSDTPSVVNAGPHFSFFSPSFLMRETKVDGFILSNSAAPPGP